LHENDYDYFCRRVKQNGEIEDGQFEEKRRCYALIEKIEDIGRQCNGRTKCELNLNINRNFENGSQSNCDFKSDRFIINYECIPHELKNEKNSLPIYDVCKQDQLENIDQGFLISPNYPNNYNGRRYCPFKIKANENRRLEMYLIDMELEKKSLLTANPTDYLEINNNGKLFNKHSYEVIYNETSDALVLFKTDNFFTKRGFLIYFKCMLILYPNFFFFSCCCFPTSLINNLFILLVVDLPEILATTQIITQNTTNTEDIITTTKPIEVTALEPIDNMKNISFLLSIGEDTSNDSYPIDNESDLYFSNIKQIELPVSNNSNNNNNSKDKINIIILVLVLFIIILISIIIALIFIKLNTFFRPKPHTLKSQSTNRNSSSTTNSSNTQYTDDSIVHLLFNSSSTQNQSINPNQIYEDLTYNQPIASSMSPPPPPVPPLLSANKLNEKEKVFNKNDYCYIQIPNVEITKSFYLNDTPVTNKKLLTQSPHAKLPTKHQSPDDSKIFTNESDSNCNYYKIPTNEPLEA
jgi:hypothetical protein